MRIFENLNFDFMATRKIGYIISGTLLVLGLLSLVIRGLGLGIDFKGGNEIALQFEKPINISEVRNYTNKIGLGNIEVKTFGGATGILLRTDAQEVPKPMLKHFVDVINNEIENILPGIEHSVVESTSNSITYSFPNADTAAVINSELFSRGYQSTVAASEITPHGVVIRTGVADIIQNVLREKLADNHFSILKEELVGPKIGSELQLDAALAVLFALLVILVYVGIRFKFVFAFGAILALFHDVIITLGVFSLLYGVFDWLNLEISINIVAAFLTLVGYSINDTVVVFDRVRENIKIHKTAPIKDNINSAINKTMPRTTITSLTTLFTVFVLMVFGGEVLRGFAFALFFGITVGTYSSIWVASSFVYEFVLKRVSKIQF